MNNYSLIQQMLHIFALSSNFIREASFDLEQLLFDGHEVEDNHIFVTGLARSGTTVLLNAIYESEEFSSLSYSDMPFVLAPNIWSKLHTQEKSLDYIERAHNDGILISTSSPEAFEEIFWETFQDDRSNIEKKFVKFIENVIQRHNKKRYLSKNNQNIKRLDLINKILPNSKIIIPFRNPIQHAFSLLTMHEKFIVDAKKINFVGQYMKLIGHTEFGPFYRPIKENSLNYTDSHDINHWIEQWYKTYGTCLKQFNENESFIFLCYEDLCKDNTKWMKLKTKLNISANNNYEFKESNKKINLKFDHSLMSKCEDLYSSLCELQNKNFTSV